MYCLFIESGVEPGVVSLIKRSTQNSTEQKDPTCDDRDQMNRLCSLRKYACLGTRFLPSKLPEFPFEAIDELLKKTGLSKKDIFAVCVGVGPGSFTGIRTSVSVAQALSFANRLPLIAVPTLLRWVPESDGHYFVCLDARMGGAFALQALVQEGRLVHEPKVYKFSLDQLLVAAQGCQIVCDQKLKDRLKNHTPSYEAHLVQDSLVHVFDQLDIKWKRHEYLTGESPEILYLSQP